MASNKKVNNIKPVAKIEPVTVGKGVEFVVKGDTLTITVDLTNNFGPSTSGKSTIIASTMGNIAVGSTGLTLGLNVYTLGKVTIKHGLTAGNEVGQNVKLNVVGNFLTITCDLSKDFGASSSGKSRNCASTRGNVAVPGDCGASIGLNLYRRV